MTTDEKREAFRQLHAGPGLFVMPNPWDVGSAKQLEDLGFAALATTSSGFAASIGRSDGEVSLEELVDHTAAICAATNIPLSVDAERCFADTAADIAAVVHVLGTAGAAGCSIEDWGPEHGIDPFEVAVDRVVAAVHAADDLGMVLTARAENLIRGVDDLDDTIERLAAYSEAGAHCVYAPGLTEPADIRRVVAATDSPVNVLLRPNGPTVSELTELGVRRVSTGGALAFGAYGAAMETAARLLA